MKLSDTAWGVLLLAFSAVVLWHVQSFPPMPGQRFGPAVFPGITAAGLGVCAIILIVRGLLHARAAGEGAPGVLRFAPWTQSPRQLLAFVLVIAVNVFYIFASGPLGFIPTAIAYLVALFLVFGVRARAILPLAIITTLVIHYAFYKLLKVPLPWGILERYAW